MPREKFTIGEPVEMLCDHLRDGRRVNDWLAGRVVQLDHRMVAVKFDTEVFASNGWPIPDRTLWCAHGSRHVRRLEAQLHSQPEED
ncbi:MAG: hypothetical protein ACRDH2_07125 [Anaerolineales bacterium]